MPSFFDFNYVKKQSESNTNVIELHSLWGYRLDIHNQQMKVINILITFILLLLFYKTIYSFYLFWE